jgi:hypothetical protein
MQPPRRYVLWPGTWARHLAWVALLIGVANMAVAIVTLHGLYRWNYFFGAMSWAAAAGMLLSMKRR